MTQQRDIERLLDQWFSDGPDQAPDRVVDIVADRIERQPQRPAWRLQWRPFPVNLYAKIAVAAAAVLIVAVVGYNLLPAGSTGVGGPAPTASPTVIPVGTPSSSPRALTEGLLAAGTYSTRPFVGDAAGVTVTVTVPNGWRGVPSWAVTGPTDTVAPRGSAIAFLQADGTFDDPCNWDKAGTGDLRQPGEKVVGPSVDALVADLRANTSYVSTAPTDITVDGHPGKQLDLQLPSTLDPASCDREAGDDTGHYYVLTPPGGLYSQGTGSRWRLRIFDVDGSRLIAIVTDYATTPLDVQAETKAILDSITISK